MRSKSLISRTNVLLILFLIFFTFLSFMIRNLPGGESHWALLGSGTEYGFIENIQNIILIYCIYLHVRYGKYFKKISGFFPYLLRTGTFIFLFYEEVSFLTAGKFKSIESINFQSELNFHQLKTLDNNVFSNINMPFFDYTFNITYSIFIFSIILFIIGFGSYFKILSSFKVCFLNKEYSFYSIIFILNIIMGSILRNLAFLKYSFVIEPELIELFLYILFTFDSYTKFQRIKNAIRYN